MGEIEHICLLEWEEDVGYNSVARMILRWELTGENRVSSTSNWSCKVTATNRVRNRIFPPGPHALKPNQTHHGETDFRCHRYYHCKIISLYCFLHSLSVTYSICNLITSSVAMSSAGLSASETGGSGQTAMSWD